MSVEVTDTFEIVNDKGLHTRAAVKVAQTAQRFTSHVVLARDDQQANAKSVMGLLLLIGSKGTRITVIATGVDAAEAVAAIGALIASRFGEAS